MVCGAHFVGGLTNPSSPACVLCYLTTWTVQQRERHYRTWLGTEGTRQPGRGIYGCRGSYTTWTWAWTWSGSTSSINNDSHVHGLYCQTRGGKSAPEGGKPSVEGQKPYYQLNNCSFQTMAKFYTGFPSFAVLMTIFECVALYIPSTRSVLPKFQQFLMVLMKLRLNIVEQDLAYRLEFINQQFSGTWGSVSMCCMTGYTTSCIMAWTWKADEDNATDFQTDFSEMCDDHWLFWCFCGESNRPKKPGLKHGQTTSIITPWNFWLE